MVENTYFPDFAGKDETEGERSSSRVTSAVDGANSNDGASAMSSEHIDEEYSTDEDTATFASSLKSSLLPRTLQQAKNTGMSLGSSIGSSDSSSDGAWEDVSDSSYTGSYTSGYTDESDGNEVALKSETEQEEKSFKGSGSGSYAEQINVTDLDRDAIGHHATSGTHGVILRHVDYVQNMDVASTNKEISEVKPIGISEAREAFEQEVPHIVPIVTTKEKVGAIDYFKGHFRKEPVVLDTAIDEECGTRTPETSVKEKADHPHDVCHSPRKRSSTEIFFIVLISLSLLTLFILLILVATK